IGPRSAGRAGAAGRGPDVRRSAGRTASRGVHLEARIVLLDRPTIDPAPTVLAPTVLAGQLRGQPLERPVLQDAHRARPPPDPLADLVGAESGHDPQAH